jgi:hypothetical protein
MSKIITFFKNLESLDKNLFQLLTTNNVPDGTKLRIYLNENGVECKGSSMNYLVDALSNFLENSKTIQSPDVHQPSSPVHSNTTSPDATLIPEVNESKFEKQYSMSSFDPVSVQALSFEFEVLHGVYKAGKPDESRQKALEDAHVKCDQALEFILEIKNTTDDFSAIVGGVTYASDTPSLANALFELYLQLQ